jgi:cobalt-zinc-cadmium efflux system protein
MSQQRRLCYVLLINVAMITGLLIVGLTSHSLGVLAAGGDYIADSAALALGLTAIYLRDKHGKRHATTIVALINGLFLLGITLFVLFQAIERLVTQNPEVHGLPVLIISLISALAMGAGVVILGHGAGNEDLHMRSVLLDTISDGLAAAAVAVAGGFIFIVNGAYWLDSAVAVAVSCAIGFGALKLLADVYRALRHKTNLQIKTG